MTPDRNDVTLSLVRELGFDRESGAAPFDEKVYFLGPSTSEGRTVGAHATEEAIREFVAYWSNQIEVAEDYLANGRTNSTLAWEEPSPSTVMTLGQLTVACQNIGYDLRCGACAELFFTGSRLNAHDEGCTTVGKGEGAIVVTTDNDPSPLKVRSVEWKQTGAYSMLRICATDHRGDNDWLFLLSSEFNIVLDHYILRWTEGEMYCEVWYEGDGAWDGDDHPEFHPVHLPATRGVMPKSANNRIETVLGYVGANVRRLRIERGWTQKELADATVDVRERYIQSLETSAANPTLRVLIDVADALGVSPSDLFAEAKLEERLPGNPRR